VGGVVAGRRPCRRRVRLLAAGVAWLATELVALAIGFGLRGSGLFYAPRANPGQLAGYMERRDPVLGWPSPSGFGHGERDAQGARIDPAFSSGDQPCVSLYGDSQTWGDEVAAGQAWGSLLARRLGCRVANYGVGGYGTDQALLRYLQRDEDHAGHVVLGHWSENVLRNVNQYRELLYPAPFGLKPRFELEASGALRHVPLPSPDTAEFERLLADPASVLTHEFFLPGTAWGPSPLRFPWSLAVARAAGHFRVRAGMGGYPAYARFYDADHPSGALPLTAAILTRFRDEARRRGQRPTPLLIPTGLDLSHRLRRGRWIHGPLAARLAEAGVGFLDAGPAILERLAGRDPCEQLFDDCSAHFNAEGNAVLAGIVFEHLCRSEPPGADPGFPGCRNRKTAASETAGYEPSTSR
jgi:hypothetical protein